MFGECCNIIITMGRQLLFVSTILNYWTIDLEDFVKEKCCPACVLVC